MKTLLFLTILICLNAHAEKKSEKKNQLNIVDKAHARISYRITKISEDIDNFFANQKHEDKKVENNSRLQLSLETRFLEAEKPIITPDINYQLILPKTEIKLQLIIQNENAEDESETQNSNINNQTQERRNNSTSAGVRYLVEESGIKFFTDSGILVSIPPQVFFRVGAKKKIQVSKKWRLKIDEQLRWVNTRGFRNDLDFDFDRRLNDFYLLRIVNNFDWDDQTYVITYETGPSLFHKIDDFRALSYHAHIVSVNQPDYLLVNYILQITYRQSVYEDWVFMNLTPFLHFPRSENFHRTPGFIVNFDAFFGNTL
jgi:hypothetical protein